MAVAVRKFSLLDENGALGMKDLPTPEHAWAMAHLAIAQPTEASRRREFEAAYREHVGFVWRSLRSLGVSDAALDDATHEVFIVLLRRWDDRDTQVQMTSWLYGIAVGVARNHHRRARRAERKLVALRAEVPTSTADDLPIRAVECRKAVEIVEAFLDRLDDRKRRVFELAEIEGMAPVDIATCLGLNLNTVGSRLRRARRQFQRFLRQRRILDDDVS